MYSTPGISQISFSIGRVARSSTSRALKPGMETSTSTMGTWIWGSSSRGSSQTAARPNNTEARTIKGVSLESTKARAIRPARPGAGGGSDPGGLERFMSRASPHLDRLPVLQRGRAVDHDHFAGFQAGDQFDVVSEALSGFDEAQPGAAVDHHEDELHLAALQHRRGGQSQGCRFAHRNGDASKLADAQPFNRRQVQFDQES